MYEARDLPPRRRLRCHLHLDGTLFARTTAKVAGPDGELFWGELFQLAALPPSRALTLSLCRDDQGHPSQTVASVTVPLTELAAARQPLERWYPLSGHGGNERAPAVRVRGRYREVRVLPIVRYKELAEFITFHYRELCARLEPTIAVRHKEELAGALVRVLQSTGKAKVERMVATVGWTRWLGWLVGGWWVGVVGGMGDGCDGVDAVVGLSGMGDGCDGMEVVVGVRVGWVMVVMGWTWWLVGEGGMGDGCEGADAVVGLGWEWDG